MGPFSVPILMQLDCYPDNSEENQRSGRTNCRESVGEAAEEEDGAGEPGHSPQRGIEAAGHAVEGPPGIWQEEVYGGGRDAQESGVASE